MDLVASQARNSVMRAKGDEVERPRVKEPVQTERPAHKLSLHAESCIAKAFRSSSSFFV
jgi:hypothetical protein